MACQAVIIRCSRCCGGLMSLSLRLCSNGNYAAYRTSKLRFIRRVYCGRPRATQLVMRVPLMCLSAHISEGGAGPKSACTF
jgi:hypothetical protein